MYLALEGWLNICFDVYALWTWTHICICKQNLHWGYHLKLESRRYRFPENILRAEAQKRQIMLKFSDQSVFNSHR